ncbi:hypothetical protein [Streptomyces sp. NPDC088785]|uniref:hypothetical protein n=1 Tax=Streptomyces sp. NPDC088785 TaxID=3365897 RepID=UPI0038248FB2
MSTGARAGLEELSAELGARPPSSFTALSAEGLAVLSDALRRERARRAAGLHEAAEQALTLVPAPARGAVRKILFRPSGGARP